MIINIESNNILNIYVESNNISVILKMSADPDVFDCYVRSIREMEERLKLEKNFENEVKCEKENEMKKEGRAATES